MNWTKEKLKAAGYDGLYYPGECACELDNLFPCGEGGEDCLPGYKHSCTKPSAVEWCKEGFGWFISGVKPYP